MFEHLDDPATFVPDDGFREGVRRRGRARRRRTLLARTGLSSLVAVAAVAGATVAMVDHKLDQVDRVHVDALAPHPEAGTDSSDDGPFTVLFVGVDDAGGRGSGDPALSGSEGREAASQRADTMILARVDPTADRVTVLPLPRDLWIEVPGVGPSRINEVTAMAVGGPSLLIEAIESDLGIAVNRYVQADFQGVVAIGDAIGGLRLSFPSPQRDRNAGLVVHAGCQQLDGRSILGFARSRHLEHQGPNGAWQRDPSSDLGRIERQQSIATALLASLSHLDTTDPGQMAELLDAIARDLTIDSETTHAELLGLFRGVAGSEIVQLRLPVAVANHDGAQVLELATGSGDVISRFLSGDGAASPGAEPTVAPLDPVPADTLAQLPTPC